MSDKLIYLMRHAEAEPFSRGSRDEERALTEHGEQQAITMAAWLSDSMASIAGDVSAAPIEVLHSPFLRTTQTAQFVVKGLAVPLSASAVSVDALLGDNSPEAVMNALDDSLADINIWVTHQPLVSSLCAWLVSGSSRVAYDFPFYPASVARLKAAYFAQGEATLQMLQHAEPR